MMPESKTAKKAVKKAAAAVTPEEVVSSTALNEPVEHEPANRPSSFKALKLRELQFAADAFGVEWENLNEETIRANLEADGITWSMYAKQFKLLGHQELPD